MKERSLWAAVTGLLMLAVSAVAAPASADSSLDDILSRGKLLVGIDLNTPPFGYLNEKQEPIGSDVETAKLIAKDLGVELEIVQVTAANRVPYLVTGKVDLICAQFGISPERAKSVWFSTPYGATGAVLVGKKSDSISGYPDLANKRVSVARGTFPEQLLTANVVDSTNVMRFDDDASASTAMMTGQADAYGTAFPIAATLAQANPELEIKFSMLDAWYGVGVKRGSADLLQWVNTFIFYHMANGDLPKIYEAAIGRPLGNLPHL